jgi:DNA-directed RNA polymerase subunit M/transcription elongation factor TFIIS
MDIVNAERAYSWECPGCGEAHYFKVEYDNNIENNIDAEKHIRDFLDLEEWQDIPEDHGLEVAKLPTEVICDSCGISFAIYYEDAYYSEDEDEDEQNDEEGNVGSYLSEDEDDQSWDGDSNNVDGEDFGNFEDMS